jgi:hypothetical protein
MEERLEKYSERFDNDKSQIGNPYTWGKRIVEEPKQETLEEAMNNNGYHDQSRDALWREGVNFGVKWQQEQDKNKFSEEEVLNFTQTMIMQYKFGNTNIEQMDLLKETLQLFKNK